MSQLTIAFKFDGALGYAPNVHARRLVRGRADHVALILRHLQGPLYAELADQFTRTFSEFKIRVSLDLVDASEEETVSAVRNLAGGMVDAIFLYPNHPEMSFEKVKAAAAGCPVICLCHKPAEAVPYIAFDRHDAGRQAVRHLLSLDRRSIGYVGTGNEADGRFAGYREALREAGVAADPAWQICNNFFLLDRGREAGEKLARLSNRPDGLFVASDLLAIGVIDGLVRAGCRVPEDVAVVSYDGISLGGYFRPALTTMAVPLPALVQRAVAMIQAIHSGKTLAEVFEMSLLLPAKLTVRESCGQKMQRAPGLEAPTTADIPAGRETVTQGVNVKTVEQTKSATR